MVFCSRSPVFPSRPYTAHLDRSLPKASATVFTQHDCCIGRRIYLMPMVSFDDFNIGSISQHFGACLTRFNNKLIPTLVGSQTTGICCAALANLVAFANRLSLLYQSHNWLLMLDTPFQLADSVSGKVKSITTSTACGSNDAVTATPNLPSPANSPSVTPHKA